MTAKKKFLIIYYVIVITMYFCLHMEYFIVIAQTNMSLFLLIKACSILFMIPVLFKPLSKSKLLIPIILIGVCGDVIHEIVCAEVCYKYTNQNSYYIATAQFEYSINRGSRGSRDYYDKYASMQLGYEAMAKLDVGIDSHVYDTVLVKISHKHNFCVIWNVRPTSAEIQKYMEPVLFIDGVEQPRPEYNNLRLSAKEREILMSQYHYKVAKVVKKEQDEFLRNLVTFQVNDTLQQTVNLMYKDEKDYREIFESIEPGESNVILIVSDIDPRVIQVVNWQPTEEEQNENYYLMIAKYKSKDNKTCYLQALSDNHISIEIPDKWDDIYREHRNDTILVKKTLGGYSQVMKCRLSAEEKKKYYTPVLFVGGKEQKTFSKEEQIEAFHNSHKCLGFIYDKQEYGLFKIGVNDSITRYHVMDTKLKNYDRLYSTVNIGDTVILRVSDSIPQLTQVLSWDPSFEEKKRYKTPVKLVEKVPTYQIATIYDKWDYVRAYSARRNTYHYQVKLKISDDIKTKYINIDDAFPKFIYNSIKEGDTVLINLPRYNLSVVEVVNWHPTSEEKIKYKRPVKLKSAN